MIQNEVIEKLREKYPVLPLPKYWEKGDIKRYYFNKREGEIDFTFYIYIKDNDKLGIGQKPDSKWFSGYPTRQEVGDFIKRESGNISDNFLFFRRPKFPRFNTTNEDLEVFGTLSPHVSRFLIGKVARQLIVDHFLLKITAAGDNFSLFSIGNNVIRNLYQNLEIISFFSIPQDNMYERVEEGLINIYVLSKTSIKREQLELVIAQNKNLNMSFINQERNKPIESKNHARFIKSFFDAILYPIKQKFYQKKHYVSKTTTHEYFNDSLLYYVDLDVRYEIEAKKPATRDMEGQRILGRDSKNINRKYLLKEITSISVSEHLKDKHYQQNMIPYLQDQFFAAGRGKIREDGTNWTLRDLWMELHSIDLPPGDIIAIVNDVKKYRPNTFYYPASRLFMGKPYIPTKTTRALHIQEIKKECVKLLQIVSNKVAAYFPEFEIVPLHELVPKYVDLMKFPFSIQFSNKIPHDLKRTRGNHHRLEFIPQELLRRDHSLEPIAGKHDFSIIMLLPDNLENRELEFIQKFQGTLKHVLFEYNLCNKVSVLPSISYKWDQKAIINHKKNIWAEIFNKDIKPKLLELNEKIHESSDIVITFLGLRNIGTVSELFKRDMENFFYHALHHDLSTLHFNVLQGLECSNHVNEISIQNKCQKLAAMIYNNTLINIAANNPQSYIARNLKQGLLYSSVLPFGTLDEENITPRIDMIAGFDASRVEGAESNEARGATICMIDPYGRQIKTNYIENALTHSGVISERAVRDIIKESITIQDKILSESYGHDSKPLNKDTLDYHIHKNSNISKRILFVYDGWLLKEQAQSFITTYQELMEMNENMPELCIFSILKSHPLRNFLEKGSTVQNIPFGTLALLNNHEILITSHMLPSRNSMVKSSLYKFNMVLKKGKDIQIRRDISEEELLQIGLQLFQTSLFNTGKSGRPLKETKVIHESHKLSKEFAEKPRAMGVLHHKD